jgi:hypothetical protein
VTTALLSTKGRRLLPPRLLGWTRSDLKRQQQQGNAGPNEVTDLLARIEQLEQKLETQQPPPADAQQEFAQGYARVLRKAQSSWYSPSDEGDSDAPRARGGTRALPVATCAEAYARGPAATYATRSRKSS